jgi:hypothetical protein
MRIIYTKCLKSFDNPKTSENTGRQDSHLWQEMSLSSKASTPTQMVIQPRVQWITESLFPRTKQPGSKTKHTPLYSFDVPDKRSYNVTPSYSLTGWETEQTCLHFESRASGRGMISRGSGRFPMAVSSDCVFRLSERRLQRKLFLEYNCL